MKDKKLENLTVKDGFKFELGVQLARVATGLLFIAGLAMTIVVIGIVNYLLQHN